MTREQFLTRHPTGTPISLTEQFRAYWSGIVISFLVAILSITGIWPWWVAGETTGSTAFIAAAAAFSLGVLATDTYRYYTSFHRWLEVKEDETGV